MNFSILTPETPICWGGASRLLMMGNKIIRPEFAEFPAEGGINCRKRLGGLGRYYYRKAVKWCDSNTLGRVPIRGSAQSQRTKEILRLVIQPGD
jgi:hypothetical protein